MPNFDFARNIVFARADTGYYPMKSSATVYAGDPVVLTSVDSGVTAARAMITGDQASLTNGILGFSAVNAVSDSSGIAGAQIVPSGVSGAAAITYNIPQYGFGLSADPGSTRSMLRVFLANGTNEFWGKLVLAPTTVAIAESLVGQSAGIVWTSATNIAIDFAANVVASGATGTTNVKSLVITGYDPNDLTRLKFRVKPAYRQLEVGTLYST